MESPQERLYVVAVGSSAGGLEALRLLLQYLPSERPFAYIVAQHLAPQHTSMLATLLARETNLAVHQVERDTALEASRIYVVAPNTNLIYENGVLRVRNAHTRGPKPCIDELFRSLAREIPDRAIAVVLSGSGSDGSEGALTLRSAGGYVIAQDPQTARYASMPAAVVAAGAADVVLSPQDIGPHLEKLSLDGSQLLRSEPKLSRGSGMDGVLEKINLATNIDFRGYKQNTILRRVRQRMNVNRCNNLDEYLAVLDSRPEEASTLARCCLISVTSFFRDTEAFDALAHAIKAQIEPTGKDPVRVWVPACSTGEEAYSIAILFASLLPERRLQLFGTDVDEASIATARLGTYPLNSVSSIPQPLLERYFRETSAGFQIDRVIRDMVVFARHDLLRDPLFLNLDIVSCRNLLIYLRPELQEEAIRKFHYALRRNGILFLGTSENPPGSHFQVLDRKAKVFTNKALIRGERQPPVTREWRSPEIGGRGESPRTRTSTESLESLLATSFAPPSVLVDQDFRILESHGEVGRYLTLRDGKPVFTLLALVPRPILATLRAQLQRTARLRTSTTGVRKQMEIGGSLVWLHTEVRLVERSQGDAFLVSFVETKNVSPDGGTANADTERELANTREHLHAIEEELVTSNEELQALNEQLQSTNEELQATNEEMAASNEELQATNEELVTVNEELEHKGREILLANEHLESIQNALDYPILVLDARGNLRHSNEHSRRMFGLSVDATGSGFALPGAPRLAAQLFERAQQVATTGQALEFRSTVNGRRFQIHVRPTAFRQRTASAAVVVFHDITGLSDTQQRLRRSENRLRSLIAIREATINSLSAHLAVINSQGIILGVNQAWRRFAQQNGYAGKRFGLGENYLALCDQAALDGVPGAKAAAEAIRGVLSGNVKQSQFDYPCHSETELRYFRATVAAISSEESSGAVILHADITEQVLSQQQNQMQIAALEAVSSAVLLVDDAGRIEWCNSNAERITGYLREELQGRTPAILDSPAASATFLSSLAECARSAAPWSGEIELRRKDGSLFSANQRIVPIETGDAERKTQFAVSFEDISSRKTSEARMRYLVDHDELTGLLNRNACIDLLRQAIARQRARNTGRVAVLFLDLDRFKETNDALGHMAGDRLLTEIADRLRTVAGDQTILGRFGGDEFLIFVEGDINRESVGNLIQRIQLIFGRGWTAQGQSLSVTFSVGAALFPDDGDTADELVRRADLAMYRAKAEGRRGYRFFDRHLESEIMSRAGIESDLSRALATPDLWVAYQPQINLRTGGIVGAESLLRWKSAERHGIPVSKVISIAEDSGLILPIGQWVIKQSLIQAKTWASSGNPLRISVNLSAVQIHKQDLFGAVMEALATVGLPPSAFKMEITESLLLNRSSRVRETLHALHGAGIGLVLDDFGTGYSSLSYLQLYPIESVKIDASFLKGVGKDTNDEAIVSGIIKLAHSLGQTVVAEGIETREQLDFLHGCDCDYAQGFYYSEALSGDDFDRYLNHRAAAVAGS